MVKLGLIELDSPIDVNIKEANSVEWLQQECLEIHERNCEDELCFEKVNDDLVFESPHAKDKDKQVLSIFPSLDRELLYEKGNTKMVNENIFLVNIHQIIYKGCPIRDLIYSPNKHV